MPAPALLPQVAELNKTMEDMKSEHVFALHRKTAELLDDLKQVRYLPPPTACEHPVYPVLPRSSSR